MARRGSWRRLRGRCGTKAWLEVSSVLFSGAGRPSTSHHPLKPRILCRAPGAVGVGTQGAHAGGAQPRGGGAGWGGADRPASAGGTHLVRAPAAPCSSNLCSHGGGCTGGEASPSPARE